MENLAKYRGKVGIGGHACLPAEVFNSFTRNFERVHAHAFNGRIIIAMRIGARCPLVQ